MTHPPSPHRLIELQSPADLTYLIANVSRAARSKIDLHFPPSAAPVGPGEEDAMKKRVEALVQDYIDTVFAKARASVSVNGIPGESVEGWGVERAEEFEPYDTRLAARITTLSASIETLNLQLADLRRTGPALAAQQFREQFEAQAAEFDAALAAQQEAAVELGQQSAVMDLGDGLDEERLAQMRAMYQRGTEGLSRVGAGLLEVKAKAERASEAAAYLEGKAKA